MAYPENPCGCTPPTHPDPCGCKLSAADVAYKGPNLGCTGIETCQTVEEILINLDQFICEGAFVQTIINNITNNISILNQFTNIVNNIVDCETVQNCINPTTSTTTTEAPLDPNKCLSYGINVLSSEVNSAVFNLIYVETQNYCVTNTQHIENRNNAGIFEDVICVIEGAPVPECYYYLDGIKTYLVNEPFISGDCSPVFTTTSTTTLDVITTTSTTTLDVITTTSSTTLTPSCVEVEINVGTDCEEGYYALFNYRDCSGVDQVVEITTGDLPRICVLDNPFPFFSCGSGTIEIKGSCGVVPTTTTSTTIFVPPTTTTSSTSGIPTLPCNRVTLSSNFAVNLVFEYKPCGTNSWIPVTLNNEALTVCVEGWRTSAPFNNKWSATLVGECGDIGPPPTTELKITSSVPGELGDGTFRIVGGEIGETITILCEFINPIPFVDDTFFISSPPLDNTVSLDSTNVSQTRIINLGPAGTTAPVQYFIEGNSSVKISIIGRSSAELMPVDPYNSTIINN